MVNTRYGVMDNIVTTVLGMTNDVMGNDMEMDRWSTVVITWWVTG